MNPLGAPISVAMFVVVWSSSSGNFGCLSFFKRAEAAFSILERQVSQTLKPANAAYNRLVLAALPFAALFCTPSVTYSVWKTPGHLITCGC